MSAILSLSLPPSLPLSLSLEGVSAVPLCLLHSLLSLSVFQDTEPHAAASPSLYCLFIDFSVLVFLNIDP